MSSCRQAPKACSHLASLAGHAWLDQLPLSRTWDSRVHLPAERVSSRPPPFLERAGRKHPWSPSRLPSWFGAERWRIGCASYTGLPNLKVSRSVGARVKTQGERNPTLSLLGVPPGAHDKELVRKLGTHS